MAKNIIPQGTTAAIKQRVNKYEETQKQRMIASQFSLVVVKQPS